MTFFKHRNIFGVNPTLQLVHSLGIVTLKCCILPHFEDHNLKLSSLAWHNTWYPLKYGGVCFVREIGIRCAEQNHCHCKMSFVYDKLPAPKQVVPRDGSGNDSKKRVAADTADGLPEVCSMPFASFSVFFSVFSFSVFLWT